MKEPLSHLIENTRNRLTVEVNKILEESKLPAYLAEGIILEILSEIRRVKCAEIQIDGQRIRLELEEELEKAKQAAKTTLQKDDQEDPKEDKKVAGKENE